MRPSLGHEMARTLPGVPVLAFGQYRFQNPWEAYKTIPHGIFLFPGDLQPSPPPASSVRSPYGTVAFYVLVK